MNKEHDLPFADDDANDSTGFLLWQVTALWQRQINTALRHHGLTQVQFVLLAGLLWLTAKEELITQVMLAKHSKMDVMMTSQVLRALEYKGYVKRQPHPSDTRAKTLSLTAAGKKIVLAAIPTVDKQDSVIFSAITPERKRFNQILRDLIKNSKKSRI